MTDASLDSLPPDRLALLLDPDAPTHWSAEDAAAALTHQLAAPLLPDLAQCPAVSAEHVAALVQQHAAQTFQSHLICLTPALEILHAIKTWARQLRHDTATPPSSPLTPGPATALYYAAIASALVRLGQRITSLTNDQLREGFTWCLTQDGTQPLRGLFETALAHIPA